MLPALIGAALCVVAALGVGAVVWVSKAVGHRSNQALPVDARPAEPAPDEPRIVSPRTTETKGASQPETTPAHVAPPPPPEVNREPPSEWPPARAFTARCRAPGGGCIEECATLAGDRCLDPCFIHTAECSKDCLMPDGTCGFPRPETQ